MKRIGVQSMLCIAVVALAPVALAGLTAALGFSEGSAFWLVSAIEPVGAAAVWIPYGGWVIDSATLMIETCGGDAAVVR